MRAWTVDADDIRVAEDFDESLLHRTSEIDSFLNPDRDERIRQDPSPEGEAHPAPARRAGDMSSRWQPARQAHR